MDIIPLTNSIFNAIDPINCICSHIPIRKENADETLNLDPFFASIGRVNKNVFSSSKGLVEKRVIRRRNW